MAVLIEAISVVVRRDAIGNKIQGGWNRFLEVVPNRTLCFDDFLARVGFMSPVDVEKFCSDLQSLGLAFVENELFIDMAVVDQRQGPTLQCDWLQFKRVEFFKPAMEIAACEFITPSGSHKNPEDRSFTVSFPQNWKYENSLSRNFQFTPTEELSSKFKFLRHENGLDVFLDLETGNEVFTGRIK
jgi:hypothetical protein